MPANHLHLIAACAVMALLVTVVGMTLLVTRIREMRRKRIDPQQVADSTHMAVHLPDIRAADNFRNLFEVPVLFYALAAIALATGHVPAWLVACAWVFVALRVVHSLIHCTYNAVLHRLVVFLASFALLIAMWIAFVVALLSRTPL
jgi:hypothetical protein